MIKVSIVVPIYKVEKYLHRCLDSILQQTYTELEIILVDDGSPDASPGICDEYAGKDSRIRVIHQKNAGSVSARRAGLLAAAGDYVTFVDGDDWIEPDMFSGMISALERTDADLVITGYNQGEEGTLEQKANLMPSGVYSGESLTQLKENALSMGAFYQPGIIPALWNKLIRRTLLLEAYRNIPNNVRMGDDAAVTYPAIARAKVIVVANELHPYNYRVCGESLSRSYDPEYFSRVYSLIESLQKNLADAGEEKMLKSVEYYKLFLVSIGMNQLLTKQNLKHLSSVIRTIKMVSQKLELKTSLEKVDRTQIEPLQLFLFQKLAAGNVFAVLFYKIRSRF